MFELVGDSDSEGAAWSSELVTWRVDEFGWRLQMKRDWFEVLVCVVFVS